MKTAILAIVAMAATLIFSPGANAQNAPDYSKAVPKPTLVTPRALPPVDAELTSRIAEIVHATGLDIHTSAEQNADKEEEWSSICVVDLSSGHTPRTAGWEMDNFLYPASMYKMYVVGELVRQVCAGEKSFDDMTTIAERNMTDGTMLKSGEAFSLSEILRLICTYSDNSAANVAIDLADRRRVTALLNDLGCSGSQITRKYLVRSKEDEPYKKAPGTVTCARHLATFLYNVETGGIAGGRGRGLIKAYLSMNKMNTTRFRAGLPDSATIYSKTGEWANFTTEAALVEDGPTRYIVCVMTAMPIDQVASKMASFVRQLHELLKKER